MKIHKDNAWFTPKEKWHSVKWKTTHKNCSVTSSGLHGGWNALIIPSSDIFHLLSPKTNLLFHSDSFLTSVYTQLTVAAQKRTTKAFVTLEFRSDSMIDAERTWRIALFSVVCLFFSRSLAHLSWQYFVKKLSTRRVSFFGDDALDASIIAEQIERNVLPRLRRSHWQAHVSKTKTLARDWVRCYLRAREIDREISIRLKTKLGSLCCCWYSAHESFFFTNYNNGDRIEWSSIRSVIIRVINKIGRPRSEKKYI